MIRIKIPKEHVLSSPMSGTTDPIEQVNNYKDNIFVYGAKRKTIGGITTVELEHDGETDFDIDHFNMLAGITGASVEYYTPYIKLPVADWTAATPTYLPNSLMTTYDDDGNPTGTVQKTWEQWVLTNYSVTENSGFKYFSTIAGTGNALDFEVLKQLIAGSYVLVDNLPE